MTNTSVRIAGETTVHIGGGVWVAAVPEPYYLIVRVRCECGKKFWRRVDYDTHYVRVHANVIGNQR